MKYDFTMTDFQQRVALELDFWNMGQAWKCRRTGGLLQLEINLKKVKKTTRRDRGKWWWDLTWVNEKAPEVSHEETKLSVRWNGMGREQLAVYIEKVASVNWNLKSFTYVAICPTSLFHIGYRCFFKTSYITYLLL